MERHEELLEQSKKKLEVAEHVMNQAFPLTRDPKLLMNATDNLFLSMSYGMGAMLRFEALNSRIEHFEDKFEKKLEIFEKHCMPRYGIRPETTLVMKKLKDINR